MGLTVLIAPDKFKGTLTAQAAAASISEGWRSVRPDDTVTLLPMSDGGDGFGAVISRLLGATAKSVKSLDAAHRPCKAQWWWHAPTRTAIVESAQVIGLAQLPKGKYHPFELDTEGLGSVLCAAAKAGAQTCLVGVGGSATNDGGFGMAKALGWQFFNTRDEKIDRWTELHSLAQVRPPEKRKLFDNLLVAVDVQNPLLGENGCTRIYGPQKGIKPADFEFAERCLEQVTTILERELHVSCASEPGTGAAGGLGYGLRCFAGGSLQPGFSLFADYAKLADQIRSSDLVITGEGSVDASSLMGKGVGELAKACVAHGVPCIAIGGVISEEIPIGGSFSNSVSVTEVVGNEKALAHAEASLQEAAAQAARQWQLQPR